jgi:predicted RNase H-like HicB family nuclease
MDYTFEIQQEVDGRWIAEVVEIPGAIAYGKTEGEAIEQAKAIANAASHISVERIEEIIVLDETTTNEIDHIKTCSSCKAKLEEIAKGLNARK